jgi:tetratricopeptide (TPR) repeat protein
MKNNTAILSKIVEILLEIKDYKSVITFIEKGLINSSSMDQTLYVHLLSAKADSFRKLEEYEESIQTYQSIIQVAYEQTLIINSYFRLAECFEKRMNVIESINCYKQILAMN